ncbi:MAG: hypothetical protein Sylvanvirus14_12 [Sylvanvirus sp.]|uniref:Uncharacterized protein n=1 Tax=Sylvanvirus sp. TaxID=2487774 RepID=A0A3G5AI92_9VIRU|nr:MAG: hypothetical protein Sylvanvirus14_12 [Sylvanvirus sp.]
MSSPVVLVHDEKQVEECERICHEVLKSIDVRKTPAMIINLSIRQKYVSETLPMDGFFRRSCFTLDQKLLHVLRNYEVSKPYVIDEQEIPSKALCAYMVFNPRNQCKALLDMSYQHTKTLLDHEILKNRNFGQEYVSFVHRSNYLLKYSEIDVDTKDVSLICKFNEEIQGTLFENVMLIVETHGGYHIVYQPGQVPKKAHQVCKSSLFKFKALARDGKYVTKSYFDVLGDVTFPVPGTYQGGFPVIMRNVKEMANLISQASELNLKGNLVVELDASLEEKKEVDILNE